MPDTFYAPAEDAVLSLRVGRPFNVIHLPSVLKFDLFPSHAFPLGGKELDRAVFLEDTGISQRPTPFVTPEGILLETVLVWFRRRDL